MVVVGAALRDRADHTAQRAAVLRRVAAGLHLDLVHEVDDEVAARQAGPEVRRLDAVHDEPVLAGARAVDRQTAQLGLVVGTRGLGDQRREVAPVGQQRDLLLADVRLTRGLLGVDDRRFGRDRHGFRHASHDHRNVDRQDLAETQVDVLNQRRREARQPRHDFVLARAQADEPVRAGRIAHRRGGDCPGREAFGLDGDAWQDGTGSVLHDADYRAGLLLREGRQ